MPPKKSTRKKQTGGKRRKSKTMRGRGLASDVVNGIHNYVKEKKLISRGLGWIPGPYGQLGAATASLLGYGKKRRKSGTKKATKKQTGGKRRKSTAKQVGRGIFSDLGGGIGNIFGGLGGGIGSVAHGFFGGSKSRHGVVPFVGAGAPHHRKNVLKM